MVRIKFLLIFFILISFQGFSQDSLINSENLKIIETNAFPNVEVEASFPGGPESWRKYLLKNLDIDIPIKNNAPAGAYRVLVKFLVSKDGTISDIQAETNHGYGMEEEVIRIIKKGPNWIPATQNGRDVKAIRHQPITFLISEK